MDGNILKVLRKERSLTQIQIDKKQLLEGKDIFKGGVIIRNPEKLEETMVRHYQQMINLYNSNRSAFKQ